MYRSERVSCSECTSRYRSGKYPTCIDPSEYTQLQRVHFSVSKISEMYRSERVYAVAANVHFPISVRKTTHVTSTHLRGLDQDARPAQILMVTTDEDVRVRDCPFISLVVRRGRCPPRRAVAGCAVLPGFRFAEDVHAFLELCQSNDLTMLWKQCVIPVPLPAVPTLDTQTPEMGKKTTT